MYIKSKIASAACGIVMAGVLTMGPSASAETALFFDGVNTPFSTPNKAEDYIAPSWYENGGTSQVVDWPRQMSLGPIPFLGWKTLDRSTDEGVANAMPIVDELHDNGEGIHLVGLSGGAIVVLKVKKAAIDKYGPDAVTETVTYGDPTNPDGGILTKMPPALLKLLGIPVLNSADSPRAQYETDISIRYDVISDAPDVSVFQNPLAWANAVMTYGYYHKTYSFEQLQEALENGDAVTTTTYYDASGKVIDPDTDFDSIYGYKSHIVINKGVTLLKPVRDFFLLINNDAGDVKVNAFFDEIDNKWVKPIVEAGYDHGPNPEVDSREISTTVKPEPPVNQTGGEDASDSADDDTNVNVSRVNVNSQRKNVQEPANPGPDSNVSSDFNESESPEPSDPPANADKPSGKERMETKKEERKLAAEERRERREEAKQNLKDKIENTIDTVRESLSPKKNDDNDTKKTTNDAGNDDKGGSGSED